MPRIDEAFNNEPATVTDHGFALMGEKGSPCVWLEFKFNNLQAENGEELTARAMLYLTEGALDYSLDKLGVLGWHGQNVCELDPNEPEAVDLKGRTALITGKIETYNGKRKPVVNFINDPNYSPVPAIDSTSLKALDGKLRGKIAAYRAKKKVPVQKTDIPI